MRKGYVYKENQILPTRSYEKQQKITIHNNRFPIISHALLTDFKYGEEFKILRQGTTRFNSFKHVSSPNILCIRSSN